jgi:hypothetical protein
MVSPVIGRDNGRNGRWIYQYFERTNLKIFRALEVYSVSIKKNLDGNFYEKYKIMLAICPGNIDACIYDFSPLGFLEHSLESQVSEEQVAGILDTAADVMETILRDIMESSVNQAVRGSPNDSERVNNDFAGRIFAMKIFRSTLEINSPTDCTISCPNEYVFFSN